MVDVVLTHVGVVVAVAEDDALDALVVPGRARPCRVAEDELLLLCNPGVADEVAREVTDRLTVLDPEALVLEVTDGWTAVTVAGDRANVAFTRLSVLELPDGGFVQGEVVHVPAKVVADRDQILLLAPSMWQAHLRDRVGRLLGVDLSYEPRIWEPPSR